MIFVKKSRRRFRIYKVLECQRNLNKVIFSSQNDISSLDTHIEFEILVALFQDSTFKSYYWNFNGFYDLSK